MWSWNARAEFMSLGLARIESRRNSEAYIVQVEELGIGCDGFKRNAQTSPQTSCSRKPVLSHRVVGPVSEDRI